MDFCVGCGGALNLFETNDDGLCPQCRRKQDEANSAPANLPGADGLFLRCRDNICHIVSVEGGLLWSGGAGEDAPLSDAIAKARRIQTIRRKRQQ